MGAWSERNFRLLFVGQTASSFGNTLVPVALAFGILDLTGSAADLGYVLGAEATALVIFLLIGGVVADRVSRRVVMLTADLARGVIQLTIGLLFLAARPSVLALILLSAALGIASAMFSPASSGLLPALVRPEYLQQANGMQQTAGAAAGVAGPAAAGILVVTIGPGWALIIDALTFFVSAALLAQLRLDRIPSPVRQHWLRDLHDGWKDFWSRRWFRSVVIASSIFNFLYSAYTVLGPVSSKEHYGGAAAWAVVATSAAIGAVAGGLAAIRMRPAHPLRVALPFIALTSLAPFAFAFLLPVAVVAVAAACGGAAVIVFETIWETSVQRHVPREILSRASSYDYFGSLIAYPAGLAVAGPLAARLGSQTVLLWVGCLMVLLVVVVLLLPSVRRLSDRQVDAGPGRASAGAANLDDAP